MEVGVEIMAENIITGEVRHIGSSYVIYVALDENGKPTPVPPLVPADDGEKEIIERAYNRRMKRQKIEKELAQAEENQ
jgi:acyl-CoA hydrolase